MSLQPNKPRNLHYFGDDKPGAEKSEPHKIAGIETRLLAAVAALAGVTYWVFTHDPLENLGKVPHDPDDEDENKGSDESLLDFGGDDDGLEDDWLLDDELDGRGRTRGATSRGRATGRANNDGPGFRAGAGRHWKGEETMTALPRVHRPDDEGEQPEDVEEDDEVVSYSVVG